MKDVYQLAGKLKDTECKPDVAPGGIERCHLNNACGLQKEINRALGKESTTEMMGRPIPVCPQYHLRQMGVYSHSGI